MKNSRFSPSSFVLNARIADALVPSAAFLLDLGGAPVVATIVVGLMIAYILDSLNFKSGSFFAVWFTLIAAQITFFFSSSLYYTFNYVSLAILSALTCALANFLIGVWASLQFKWMQIEHPTIVLALERLLFVCVPLIASTLFTWATVSAVGMWNAAYYLMVFNCIFYWLYSVPRVSSFKLKQEVNFHGGEVPEDSFILGQLECCVHTLSLLFIPVLFHIASHYLVMFSSSAAIFDLFLLFFIPLLLQLYASTRGALWWVTNNEYQLQIIRFVNGAVALVVIVICLEIRVVFHSFGRYIHAPPPLNYLLVTITMLGGAAAAAGFMLLVWFLTHSAHWYSLHWLSLSVLLERLLWDFLSCFLRTEKNLKGNYYWKFLPLPSVAGYCLARFFTKKSLSSYSAFVVLGSLMVAWFMMHNYWDLNIWIAGMSLKSFCKLIVGSVLLAMAVPGLAVLPPQFFYLTEAGLISHALLLCYIENNFFNYSNVYYYGMDDDVIYPSYMVVLTTFAGLAVVRRLSVDRRIGSKAVWVLICLYFAKLSMLVMASKNVLWVSAVLFLAVSPPLLLYKDKSKSSASKMKPINGYAHAGVVALSVWFCLACIPIVALHFSHVMAAKRYLVLVIATGLLFIVMQPPIPLAWTYHSDLIRSAPILLTLAGVTSVIPISYIVELRTFYAIAVGIALGIYISAEYFLQAAVLHALIIVTMVCASIFVVFTHLPSSYSTKFLPWMFALIVALFPVTYLLEGQVRINKTWLGEIVAEDMAEEGNKFATLLAVEGARTSLLGLYAAIFMLIAIEIKFELASLIRGKFMERGGLRHSQSGESSSAMVPPRLRYMKQRRASTLPAFTTKQIAAEGAWMPAVGNVATVMCFAISLILNVHLTGGSNRAIFFLAPILLLLNQDSDFFAGFGDKQRYFPVTVAISTYLVSTAVYSIWEDVWHGNTGWGVDIRGPDWIFAVKNLALLVLTFPRHILFNRFVWSYTKQADSRPLLTIPLNLPPIIMTDIMKIKILGLLGVIYSLAQYLISRQQYLSGLKYI
ncbi:hypothetical protein SASPL_110905 [Salvia splendens]|uniref:No exine formation 1 n=1 Tax=Salvia splendens TaxID=180675 RepID=A0A8X8YBE6_SALSN|nr:hypothetical protein SASPL_110905 [Salvia splendens]